MASVPTHLQHVLWSTDVNSLDTERDAGYIIHQIFSYGGLDDIRWVLKHYSQDFIKQIFLTQPYKDYRAARFFLIKDYLLGLKDHVMNEKHYVKNIPRDLGRTQAANLS